MTSSVTKKFFKIGHLGDFEKMHVLYVAMAEKIVVLNTLDTKSYLFIDQIHHYTVTVHMERGNSECTRKSSHQGNHYIKEIGRAH